MTSIFSSQSKDPATGYSGFSIAVHWIGAIVVIALWILGSSIATAGAKYREAVQLHTSFAVLAYFVLWFRVIWRMRSGHPARNPNQGRIAFSIGKAAHYLLLAAIVLMLVSGPLSVWLGEESIHVFGASIPSPFSARLAAADFAHRLHAIGANAILIMTFLHIGGVVKHTAVNGDGTLERILIAGKRSQDSEKSK